MKTKSIFSLLLWLPIFIGGLALASDQIPFPEVPNPPRLVSDYIGLLSKNETRLLEEKLVQYEDSTGNQFAIVILSSTGDYAIDDYTIQLANKWQIGTKENRNGLLILTAIDDREIFIATGYGLEGAIPDVSAYHVIREAIQPNFKKQNYFKGLDEATNMLMLMAAGEYTKTKNKSDQFPILFVVLVIFIVFIVIISVFRTRRYAYVNHIDFWTAWQLLNAARKTQRGKWGSFSSGTFGKSSGGGFGGFGGGSFGGGGAGGSW
ncbi:MAG TPA: TPM domain-containing protein [Bacteroidia bacterium]|nr:TPM domain-containing protein [Bacteroidia bacterium]